jgi:hypothetical protein
VSLVLLLVVIALAREMRLWRTLQLQLRNWPRQMPIPAS